MIISPRMLEGKRDVSQICPYAQVKTTVNLTDNSKEKAKFSRWRISFERKEKKRTLREKKQRGKKSIFGCMRISIYVYICI